MLDLLVATRGDTFERIQEPLSRRDVRVRGVDLTGRTVPLSDPPWDGADVGLVFPGRLMEGAVLDAAIDLPWVNDRTAVLTSRNKAGVLAALAEAGVPVPRTTLVSNPVDDEAVRAAFDRFDPPVVVKPNSATRGTGVTRVADPDSLVGVTDYLDLVHDYRATGDKSYLLQEFLPDARDYRVMVIDGACAGAVERRGPGWTHNVHRGAEAVGVDPPDSVRALAERTAAVLDVPWLGVDVLVGDGRAVVAETNARPTVDDAEKYDPDFYDRLADLVRRVAATGHADE